LTGKTLEYRSKLAAEGKLDDKIFKYARQFAQADIIVIAAPFWDLSFPALLKSYIEAINIVGIVFEYSPEGKIIGLCRAKKLIYVTAAGGYIPEVNCGFGYISELAEILWGIKDLTLVKAEGLDIKGNDVEKILEQSRAEIDRKF